jgi:hypothetical protein
MTVKRAFRMTVKREFGMTISTAQDTLKLSFFSSCRHGNLFKKRLILKQNTQTADSAG